MNTSNLLEMRSKLLAEYNVLSKMVYKTANQLRHFKVLQFIKHSINILKNLVKNNKNELISAGQEQKAKSVFMITGHELRNGLKSKVLIQIGSILFACMARIMYIFPQYCYDWNSSLSKSIVDQNEEGMWGMDEDFNIKTFDNEENQELQEQNEVMEKSLFEVPKQKLKNNTENRKIQEKVTDSKEKDKGFIMNDSKIVSSLIQLFIKLIFKMTKLLIFVTLLVYL